MVGIPLKAWCHFERFVEVQSRKPGETAEIPHNSTIDGSFYQKTRGSGTMSSTPHCDFGASGCHGLEVLTLLILDALNPSNNFTADSQHR